ncbi:MAG: UDP-3-O-[3-hydroxymyristoyl] glucosamine N-acyltransferase [Flavobacteriales bacterium]|jgi:UDP-3-O-[3-hydroxymyristoyl] glucosamine N-acyltransferase
MKFNNINVQISSLAILGKNVKVGDNTIIYDNVVIGDNTVICNDCTIGEPLNSYYSDEGYINPKTIIGSDSLVRSHSILYAGSIFGDYFSCGHRVTVRENVHAQDHLSIGTLSDIQGFVKFGRYCRLHSNVHIGQKSIIGNFVFIYPYVVFTNDPLPPSNICIGPKVGDYTQIAVHSILLPGAIIGENCLIAANASVKGDFGDGLLIVGSPAKALGSILKLKDSTNLSYYPWMYNFERGMPWAGRGFKDWYNEEFNLETPIFPYL